MNLPSSFIFMTDWVPLFEMLDTKEESDELLTAIVSIVKGQEPIITHKKVKSAFKFIEPKVVANLEKWNETREARAEAGRQGGLAKASKAKQMLANAKQKGSKAKQNLAVTVTDTVTVTNTDTVLPTDVGNERESTKEISLYEPKSSKRSFSRPSLADIEQFILDNSIDDLVSAEVFFDYYESNGWKVGKVPMKDWRAAVRMWARRERKDRTEKTDSFLNIDWGNGE